MTTENPASTKRSRAIKALWEDPAKRAEMLSRTQSPQAKSNRAKSLARCYHNDPELVKKSIANLDNARLVRQRNAAQRRIETEDVIVSEMVCKLGLSPSETLRNLYWLEDFEPAEIAQKVGTNPETVEKWLDIAQIAKRPQVIQRHLSDIELVRAALASGHFRHLKPMDSSVLINRYIPGGAHQTLQQIADYSGYTRQGVHVVEQRAIKKLKRLAEGLPPRVRKKEPSLILGHNPGEKLKELLSLPGMTDRKLADMFPEHKLNRWDILMWKREFGL